MRLMLAVSFLAPALAFAHGGEVRVSGFDLATWVALALSAGLYLASLGRGAALGRANVAAFAAGWMSIVVALFSPLDRWAETSFSLHMTQHLLLMMAAPPLLILGRPFTALGAVLPPGALKIAALPLRTPPPVAWGLHAAALWAWHVPRLFDAGLASEGVHAAQHACFFGSALLFWWTVFRRVRTGVAVLYLLTTLIHSGALAALLTFAPAPLYADTPLAEQQLGGLLMWVPAGYALLLAGMLAFHRVLERHA